MSKPEHKDDNKKAKNIAAIVFLLFLTFIVGGSYINQQHNAKAQPKEQTAKNE